MNGHLEVFSLYGGNANFQGHVNNLHMYGGSAHIYGHVDCLVQHGGTIHDNNIQMQHQPIVKYRDRVVKVVKWRYKTKEKIVYKDNDETARLRELLDAVMEVNHSQAARIKELERIISEHRETEIPDQWNVKPTKADCERLLKQFDMFVE